MRYREFTREQVLSETVYFKNTDRIPSRFAANLRRLARALPNVDILEPQQTPESDDVVISFGNRGQGLPTAANTIYIGNAYYPKDKQSNMLKGVVPTIKTYTDHTQLDTRRMIAKLRQGERQRGQYINQIPPEAASGDYIYQPLVDIKDEFRVVCYYMNGSYHVSGIYHKSGSNVSFRSIDTQSSAGAVLADTAVKAAQRLGYGWAGCDIALVSNQNRDDINEAIGKLASAGAKLLGKLASINTQDNTAVVLEVNSFPSVTNPAILQDLIDSILSNKV